MKFGSSTQKAPVADELGGDRDEGLESPTPMKEQEIMHQSTVPTRLDLEGLVIDVDPSTAPWEHVEITFSTRWARQEPRSTYGVALTPAEALKLAEALLDGVAPHLLARTAEHPISSDTIQKLEEFAAVNNRFNSHQSLTPAKAAMQMREAH